jgi:hypothetical protein
MASPAVAASAPDRKSSGPSWTNAVIIPTEAVLFEARASETRMEYSPIRRLRSLVRCGMLVLTGGGPRN